MKALFFASLITMLVVSTHSHADEYLAPTQIALSIADRQQQISQAQHSGDALIQRTAWLAELATITSQQSDDNSRIERLQKKLQQALTDAPDDAELMAALGSLYSYQSSLFTDNLAKLNVLMRKGTRYMDRAVKQAPTHLGARLQRGLACANMPAFVKRAHFAVQDLTLVKEQIGETYGSDFSAFIDYYLAQALLRDGQPNAARDLWQQASQIDSQWGVKAQQALAAL